MMRIKWTHSENRGEIPREHGALCSGEKNGHAVVGEKVGAAGEKSEAKRDKLGCLWGAKRHEKNGCAAVGGKKGRVAP